MQANRISYWLDGKGPSITVEMGCSSSMLAFEEALRTIKHGQCDSAIVTGSNNIIDPMLSFNMRRYVFFRHSSFIIHNLNLSSLIFVKTNKEYSCVVKDDLWNFSK